MSVLMETRGAVALLVMNKPENQNALATEMIANLNARLEQILSDNSLRAVVLTGAGVFCSGLNIADSEKLAGFLKQIYVFPKPIVAATEGAAIAGGAGLALACDLIVAGKGTQFAYTEAKLGGVTAIVSLFLLRCIGEKHARELLLTGKTIDATEAKRMGLVNEIVPDGQAIVRAVQLALEISKNSMSGLAFTKQALANIPGLGLDDALQYAVDLNARAQGGDK